MPTEISVSNPNDPDSWTTAGDDYRGVDGNNKPIWLWNSQEYDWKGRVTRSIPSDSNGSDGKDQLISYEGCGCAGGQVTTIQGALVPRDDDPNQTARRTQKVYEDILGRTFKAEVYKWDGTTIYSTVLTTFNGRDQAVSVVQKDNTQNPVVEQTTTMTYDGHGRLKTSHRPEQQDSNGAPLSTTYNYNTDDTKSSVVDARGVTTSFSYNSRGLLDEMSYSVPQNSNIPVTPTVEFDYDALGNRTQMTDGYGNVQYEYNSLSQLTAETRQFNDTLPNAPISNNKFKLEYSYNLSGRLASLKDPYGKQVNYTHDKVGRLDAISGTTFADVTNYLSNIEYRAWSAPKEINYGNGIKMDAIFNQRLQAAEFTLTKTSNSTTLMHKEYEYYADGNLRYIEDSLTPQFDRLFKYDFNLKLKQTRTGAEARGETNPDETQIKYRQDYSFNPFGQLTNRTGDWRPEQSCEDPDFAFNKSFQNNRNTGTGYYYDADGRQTSGKGIHNVYDAAGRIVKTYNGSSDYEMEFYFDGNQQEVKRKRKIWDDDEEQWGDPTIYYYIRSTALSGEIISEVKDDGQKRQTFVYASGERLATQKTAEESQSDKVIWEMWDASRNSSINTDKNGSISGAGLSGSNHLELDPLGNNVNYFCFPTYPWAERGRNFNPWQFSDGYQNGWSIGGECYVDGSPTTCDVALGLVGEVGAGIESITTFDFPVFSVQAGLQESAAFESVTTQSLEPDGYEPDTYEDKPDELKIQAGAPIFKVVYTSVSLGKTVKNVNLPPITDADIREALIGCIKSEFNLEKYGVSIKLNSISFSSKGNNGTSNITYTSRNDRNVQAVNQTVTITNDVKSLSSSGIKKLANQLGFDPKHPLGLTTGFISLDLGVDGTANYTPLTNYTANDIDTAVNKRQLERNHPALPDLIGVWKTAQIHELGNSISKLIGGSIGEPGNPVDTDSGQVLARCVENKLRK